MTKPVQHTEPREIPRRLALWPPSEVADLSVEVWACRRRWAYGRTDVYIEPVRGNGGTWVREESLEWLEPEDG